MCGNPRIVIVGPGAMGCGVSALLQERGASVALLDYRPERAEYLSASGIDLHQEGQWRKVRVRCSVQPADLGIPDLVIVLVKAYATASAAETLRSCVGPSTSVLTLQNGLGNWETLQRVLELGGKPGSVILAGTIVMGAATEGIGKVRLSGVGPIVLGSPTGDHERAHQVAEELARFWPQVQSVEDVEAALWRKAIANAAINPLTALHEVPNGRLLEEPELRADLRRLVEEAVAVARASGVEPFDTDPIEAVEGVCRLTAANHSSMFQDLSQGRRTEIDQINGEIVRRGAAAGIATPLGEALVARVKAREGR